MFRLFFLIALISTTYSTSIAQDNNVQPKIIIGPQVGLAYSQANARPQSKMIKQHAMLRPCLGIFADIGANHLFSLRTGISYLMMGNKVDFGAVIAKTKLNYVSIPALAKYKARNSEFAFFAGPQISFLTSAKYKRANREWADIKDRSEKTDISGVVGISIEPHNTPLNFTLSGLLSFTKGYRDDTETDLYNRGIIFTVQYKLFKR